MNGSEWSKLYNLLQWDDDMDLVLGNADDEWFDAYTFEDFIKTMTQEAREARLDYFDALDTSKQFPNNPRYKKDVQEAAQEYNRFVRVIKALESVKDKFPDHSKQDEKERKVWDKLANYGINNKYQINEVAQELRELIGCEWEDESDEGAQVEAAASNMEQYVPLSFYEVFGDGSEAGPADYIPYLEAVQNLDHRCYEYFDSRYWSEYEREGEIWDEVINAIDTPEIWTILANVYKYREFFNSLEESLVEDIVKDDDDMLYDDTPVTDTQSIADIIENVSSGKIDAKIQQLENSKLVNGQNFKVIEAKKGEHTNSIPVTKEEQAVYAFKYGNDWLKVGQAAGKTRILQHYLLFPKRKGGWKKASTLATSLMLSSKMQQALRSGGVDIDLYNQLAQDTTLTSTELDKKYKEAGGKTTIGEWINNNCERYVVVITKGSAGNKSIIANFVEGLLQYALKPVFEGTTSHTSEE